MKSSPLSTQEGQGSSPKNVFHSVVHIFQEKEYNQHKHIRSFPALHCFAVYNLKLWDTWLTEKPGLAPGGRGQVIKTERWENPII